MYVLVFTVILLFFRPVSVDEVDIVDEMDIVDEVDRMDRSLLLPLPQSAIFL